MNATMSKWKWLGLAVCMLVGARAEACDRPLQQSGAIRVPAGMMNGLAYVSVPQGYRYVVEYIDAGIRVQTRTESADFHVGVVTGGSRIDFALPVMPGFTEIDRKTSGQVKLYADPGTRLQVSVSRSNPNVATLGSYAISGCLLPAG